MNAKEPQESIHAELVADAIEKMHYTKEQAELEHAGFVRDVAMVRAKLAQVREMCCPAQPNGMIPASVRELLLRMVVWAEDVLQRHGYDATWDCCDFHEYGTEDSSWPCVEVRAVFRAWLS